LAHHGKNHGKKNNQLITGNRQGSRKWLGAYPPPLTYLGQSRRNFRNRFVCLAAKSQYGYGDPNYREPPFQQLFGKEADDYRSWLETKDFQLLENEKSVLFGTLLSDGTLGLSKYGTCRFKVGHNAENTDLVQWEYKNLQVLCRSLQGPKLAADNTVYFETARGTHLKWVYDLFYQVSPSLEDPTKLVLRKTITTKLLEQLPPTRETLTAIFCCDGSVRNDCYAGKIAFQCFSKQEQELFCEWLKNHSNIEAKVGIHSRPKNQYSINIPAKSFGRLVSIIEPIIEKDIPSMVRKLNRERKLKSKNL
jgi:LAGLIDADG DNA endonuclease family